MDNMDNSEKLNKLEMNLRDFLFVSDEAYIENLLRLGWDRVNAERLAAWDWPHGVGLYCLWKRYLLTGDESIIGCLWSWYESRAKIGLPIKNVNTVAPLLTLAFLYEKEARPGWKDVMMEWGNWIMNDMDRTPEGGLQHRHAELTNHGDLWDDTLFMTCLFLAKAGKLFNLPSWVEEAEYQMLLHMKYLVEKNTGLWYHAWSFDRRDNYAGALWGRGNCWITIFIPEFLDITGDEDKPVGRMMIYALAGQVASLKEYQDPSGLWHTLLTDSTSYLESSASAGFAAGILKAVRKGYLPSSYLSVAKSAMNALMNEIDENGVVQHVSYGTNAGTTLDFYKTVPIKPMQYGQGLTLLASIEYRMAVKEGLV